MALPDLLPLLKGWRYHSDVRGAPALQQPFTVQPNQQLVLVPAGLTGWFVNAEIVINSGQAIVNLVIDGVTTRITPMALGFGASANRYGLLTSPVGMSYDVDAPQYGPLYAVNYDVTADPVPFNSRVQVYLTTQSAYPVTVIGSEVNLCLIDDPAAFVVSYRSAYGTVPRAIPTPPPVPTQLGGR